MHASIEYDIVLPFYKDYEFLDRQIEQINFQTLLPKRLIFVDDGNKDNELNDKIKSLLNKKIDLIFISFKENKGVYKANQEGLKYIRSEYFRFNATDDIYYPPWDKLAKYDGENCVLVDTEESISDKESVKSVDSEKVSLADSDNESVYSDLSAETSSDIDI